MLTGILFDIFFVKFGLRVSIKMKEPMENRIIPLHINGKYFRIGFLDVEFTKRSVTECVYVGIKSGYCLFHNSKDNYYIRCAPTKVHSIVDKRELKRWLTEDHSPTVFKTYQYVYRFSRLKCHEATGNRKQGAKLRRGR